MQSTLWQLGLTWHTLVDWGNFIHDVCSEDVRRHPIQLGGLDANGDPIIVEIDESKFFNRKYNRGQWRGALCVLGDRARDRPLRCAGRTGQDCGDAPCPGAAVDVGGDTRPMLGGVRRHQ